MERSGRYPDRVMINPEIRIRITFGLHFDLGRVCALGMLLFLFFPPVLDADSCWLWCIRGTFLVTASRSLIRQERHPQSVSVADQSTWRHTEREQHAIDATHHSRHPCSSSSSSSSSKLSPHHSTNGRTNVFYFINSNNQWQISKKATAKEMDRRINWHFTPSL